MILGRISTTTVVVGEVNIQIIQFCDKNCDRLYGISEHDYFWKVKRLNEKGKSQKDNETGS